MREPSFPPARRVEIGDGVGLAAYEMGEARGARPPVVLLHGWPEIARAWRRQLPAIAAAGFRAIAIDLKGFGASDAPHDVAAYSAAAMADDFVGLLNALDIDRAIFCGHDWGGAVVWPMAQRRPARVAGAIGVCTPHRPVAPAPPTEILRDRFGPDHYIVRFQEPGAAEALFARDLRRFFRMMMRPGAPRSRWAELVPKVFDLMGRFSSDASFGGDDLVIDTDDLEAYLHAYERSGLHGGINLYRNIDANNAARADADPPIAAPSLYVGAENDVFLPPEGADPMAALVPDLERHVIPDCGHWITHEAPDALNAILIDWLTRRFPASAV